MNNHNLRRFFFDILRDENSSRYTMTKFAAFVGLLLLTATVIMSLVLMWKTKVVDHVLFLELLGFVLTLLGFKNNFGFKETPTSKEVISSGNDNDGQMGDGQGGGKCAVGKPEPQKADFVNDTLISQK